MATTACEAPTPLRIGFVGPLSGRFSDLGVPARNAARLAVDQINARGGIGERRLELLVEDDAHDVQAALAADRRLLDRGVVAVVGHMTSAMSVRAAPLFDAARVVLLSPTTSTNELTGKDDYFFRIYPYSADTARRLARWARGEMGVETAAILYDLRNRAHTESAATEFETELASAGGRVVFRQPFASGPELHYLPLARRFVAADPDVVYLLANARDSAMLCQQLRKLGARAKLIASDWAASPAVLTTGGRAVEGLFYLHSVDLTDDGERFVALKTAYRERFGEPLGFAAIHAYDAVSILAQALRIDPDPRALKDTLRRPEGFAGVQADLRFDEHGDVIRAHFPVRIQDGAFVTEAAE